MIFFFKLTLDQKLDQLVQPIVLDVKTGRLGIIWGTGGCYRCHFKTDWVPDHLRPEGDKNWLTSSALLGSRSASVAMEDLDPARVAATLALVVGSKHFFEGTPVLGGLVWFDTCNCWWRQCKTMVWLFLKLIWNLLQGNPVYSIYMGGDQSMKVGQSWRKDEKWSNDFATLKQWTNPVQPRTSPSCTLKYFPLFDTTNSTTFPSRQTLPLDEDRWNKGDSASFFPVCTTPRQCSILAACASKLWTNVSFFNFWPTCLVLQFLSQGVYFYNLPAGPAGNLKSKCVSIESWILMEIDCFAL